MSLLRIRNLSVAFSTASGAFQAVDAVDFDVDPGEILAIVGESGSGKSVSMLALMGLLPWTATVTADEITFDGEIRHYAHSIYLLFIITFVGFFNLRLFIFRIVTFVGYNCIFLVDCIENIKFH